jgi:IS1 family transposase
MIDINSDSVRAEKNRLASWMWIACRTTVFYSLVSRNSATHEDLQTTITLSKTTKQKADVFFLFTQEQNSPPVTNSQVT